MEPANYLMLGFISTASNTCSMHCLLTFAPLEAMHSKCTGTFSRFKSCHVFVGYFGHPLGEQSVFSLVKSKIKVRI